MTTPQNPTATTPRKRFIKLHSLIDRAAQPMGVLAVLAPRTPTDEDSK